MKKLIYCNEEFIKEILKGDSWYSKYRKHIFWTGLILGFLCIFLTVSFYFITKQNPNVFDRESYAMFGDFLGGVVNPVLSFITIALLLVSILISVDELKATREELAGSRDAADKQQEVMYKTFNTDRLLSAFDVLFNRIDEILNTKVSVLEYEMQNCSYVEIIKDMDSFYTSIVIPEIEGLVKSRLQQSPREMTMKSAIMDLKKPLDFEKAGWAYVNLSYESSVDLEELLMLLEDGCGLVAEAIDIELNEIQIRTYFRKLYNKFNWLRDYTISTIRDDIFEYNSLEAVINSKVKSNKNIDLITGSPTYNSILLKPLLMANLDRTFFQSLVEAEKYYEAWGFYNSMAKKNLSTGIRQFYEMTGFSPYSADSSFYEVTSLESPSVVEADASLEQLYTRIANYAILLNIGTLGLLNAFPFAAIDSENCPIPIAHDMHLVPRFDLWPFTRYLHSHLCNELKRKFTDKETLQGLHFPLNDNVQPPQFSSLVVEAISDFKESQLLDRGIKQAIFGDMNHFWDPLFE